MQHFHCLTVIQKSPVTHSVPLLVCLSESRLGSHSPGSNQGGQCFAFPDTAQCDVFTHVCNPSKEMLYSELEYKA